MRLKIAFVAGYCPIKLPQKLSPLHELDEVQSIDLFSRKKYETPDMPKLRWIYIPGFFGISVLQELARLLALLAAAWKYDLIIACHQTYHGVWAWLAGKLWRKPVIQMVITDIDWVNEKFFPSIAMLSADACGVRGPLAAGKLRKLGFKRQIETLHNTIGTMPRLPDGGKTADIGKLFDLLAVASYGKEKNFPWMFEIISETAKKMPSLLLAIAGDGQEHLKKLVKQKRLEANVKLLGPVYGSELALLYCQSKALLLSSETEGLPMVVLEAFSFGIPAFVSDAGELPWIVRDGIDGKVVAHGATAQMSGCILDAFQDPTILENMGRSAMERFVELSADFSPRSIGDCWKRLIRAALKNKGIKFEK